jgi:AraC-like DNA-binding protein
MSEKRRTTADEPYFTIRTASGTFRDGSALEAHSHPWGQLIFATSGVVTVWTTQGSWVAPPNWAVWAPAGVQHSIRFTGSTSLRTLYLRPDLRGLPQRSTVIIVSTLLRELVVRAVSLGFLDERSETDRAATSLIVSELREHPAVSLELPRPASEKLNRVAEHVAASPGANQNHAGLAKQFGVSVRTLERGFLSETGLTLGRWRRRMRFLHAIRQIGAGASVKVAALDCGYSNPSAFVAAFRDAFATTPARYFHAPASKGDERRCGPSASKAMSIPHPRSRGSRPPRTGK